jgi:hypothetical protein
LSIFTPVSEIRKAFSSAGRHKDRVLISLSSTTSKVKPSKKEKSINPSTYPQKNENPERKVKVKNGS